MAEVGSVEFNINVNNNKANKALDESSKKIDNLAKATKNADEQTAKSAKNMGNAWDSLKSKLTGAVIIGSVVGLGKAMMNTATEFEQARGVIARGTGATGEALDTLFENARSAFKELPQSINEVADGLQDINTRFGYTGETLENAVKQFAEFAKISGQSISSASSNASKLANKWKLSGKDVYATLDKITAVAQASGIGIGQLEAQLTESSNRLMAMGLSLDESISLLGSLEKYGVNASSAIMAMSMSFAQSGKSGKDAKAVWQSFTEAVKNATTDTEANLIASQKLGTRYAAELLPALRKGALDFNVYAEAVKGANGITDQTFNDSLTSVEKMQMALKPIKAEMGDLALSFVNDLLPAFNGFLDTIKENLPEIKEVAKVFLNLADAAVKLPAGLVKTIGELSTMNKKAYGFMRDLFNADEITKQFKTIEANYDDFMAKFSKKMFNNVKFDPFEVIIEQAPELQKVINDILRSYKGTTGQIGQMLDDIATAFDSYRTSAQQAKEATWEFNSSAKAIDFNTFGSQIKVIEEAFKELPSNMELANNEIAKIASSISSYISSFSGGMTSLMNNIISLIKAPYEKQIKESEKAYKSTLKILDKEETETRNSYDKRANDLEEMYARQEISEAEYIQGKEDLRIAQLKADEEAQQAKEKAEEEYRARRESAERKAYEAQKANQYAMAVIDFVKGVAEGYSHGLIIGTINAGILAGVMGTQLALISQQQYTPSFAIGTDRVADNGLAMLHKNEAVLNVADANRYRYDKSHISSEPQTPVFNIVLQGNVDVDGIKLADIVLRNWNSSYNNVVGRT